VEIPAAAVTYRPRTRGYQTAVLFPNVSLTETSRPPRHITPQHQHRLSNYMLPSAATNDVLWVVTSEHLTIR
jgi:hypothetical protein